MNTSDMTDAERMEMMAEHVQRLEELVHWTQKEFLRLVNRYSLIRYGVCKALELVGEAAHYITADGRLRYSNIDFNKWANLRHTITHAYGDIDIYEIWEIIWKYIPNLHKDLREYGYIIPY